MQCNSPGDFRAGQAVRVLNGGHAASVSPPDNPSIAAQCTGGSCNVNGNETYQYAIASVDNYGAISRAGAPATIQSTAAPHGGGSTMVFNHVSWNSEPEAAGYLIYRGELNQPMQLIDVSVGAHTDYKDYGRSPMVGANLPMSPPTQPMAADLFTTVRAVNGAQITLVDAAGVTASNVALMHDDTAALQRMFAALPRSGATVEIPAGHYNLNVCTMGAFGQPLMVSLFGKNNLMIKGSGSSTVLDLKQCRNRYFVPFGYVFSTQPNQNGRGSFVTTMYEHQTVATIRPATAGQNRVVIGDRDAARQFAPGDYVFVRTGQTLNPPFHEQPDSELNRITAVDAATGTITLAHPLAKSYAKECFGGGDVGTSTKCGPGAAAALLGLAKVTAETTHDITVRDMTFLGDVKPFIFAASQIDGFHVTNVTARAGNLLTDGDAHDIEIDHCNIKDWDGTAEAFGAKGVSDVSVHDNYWTALTSLAIQANEGTSDMKIYNNRFSTSGAPTFPSWNYVLGLRSRCHNVSITGNTFTNDVGAAIIRADPGCERVTISNNIFNDMNAVNAGVLPAGSTVRGNQIQPPVKPIVDFQGHAFSE